MSGRHGDRVTTGFGRETKGMCGEWRGSSGGVMVVWWFMRGANLPAERESGQNMLDIRAIYSDI